MSNTRLTAIVHHTVSSTNELVAALEALIRLDQDTYQLPKSTLEDIRVIMSASAVLNSQLFEENQRIMDAVEKVAKKSASE